MTKPCAHFLLISSTILLLSACGQSGPLYLPSPEKPPASHTVTTNLASDVQPVRNTQFPNGG